MIQNPAGTGGRADVGDIDTSCQISPWSLIDLSVHWSRKFHITILLLTSLFDCLPFSMKDGNKTFQFVNFEVLILQCNKYLFHKMYYAVFDPD